MPRVLVSGASGTIGSAVVPALQADGYQVFSLVRRSPGPEEIQWDPFQPLPPSAVDGFEAVVHLAGESIAGRWTEAKKRKIRDSRVLGTTHLAQALAGAAHKPQVLVCASAIGYYGDRGDEVLREESQAGQDFLAGVCREWEAATMAAADAGIRTVNLRIGVVLSKHGGALQQMLPPFRMGLGGVVGSGQQWYSWVHVQDLAGAVLHVLKSDLSGPVNAVAPAPATNRDFTKTLGKVLRRPTVFPLPAFAARLAFGQMADELLLSSQRVEPAKLGEDGFQFKYTELAGALQDLLQHP